MDGRFVSVLASAPTRTTTTPDPSQVLRDSFHPLTQVLLALWPLWSLILLVGFVRLLMDVRRVRRLRRAGLAQIDRMSGHEFERRLIVLFKSLGYRAELVGAAGGDYGADLVVSKNGTRTVVQAKCWKRKHVGLKAVQEVVGAKPMYRADRGLVVTNSRFTKQARILAEKHGVQLWDRDELVRALLQAQKVKPAPAVEGLPREATPVTAPLALSLDAEPVLQAAPAAVASSSGAFCARCGDPVSVKVRTYCEMHAERFGGLVYCFEDQKAFRKRRT